MYVIEMSPYPWDRGVTGWYQSLGYHIQYHRFERIQDLLAEEPHFIPSNKHIVRHRGDQELGQMTEGGNLKF